MRKNIKLQTKITLLIIIVVALSISVIIFFVASLMTRSIESKATTNIMIKMENISIKLMQFNQFI